MEELHDLVAVDHGLKHPSVVFYLQVGEFLAHHAIKTLPAHLRPSHVATYAHIIQKIYPQTTVETLRIYALHLFLGMA